MDAWKIALAVMVLTAPPALAGCGYERCFGALASGDNGAVGRASGFRTVPDAVSRALKVCGSTCDKYEVFWNACAAFADDSKGNRSFGWEDTRAIAESVAIAHCEATGNGCRIRAWACSK